MWHRIEFDLWDAVAHTSRREHVDVDAEGGDDAVSRGSLKAAAQFPGMGMKIVAVYPIAPPEGEAQPEAPREDERALLLAEAERRGIPVDRRWGVARLREALA